MFKSGVYCISNIVNGKVYIGSAAGCVRARIKDHKVRLKLGLLKDAIGNNQFTAEDIRIAARVSTLVGARLIIRRLVREGKAFLAVARGTKSSVQIFSWEKNQ